MWQAERVECLIREHLDCDTQIVSMSTTGDKQSQWNLSEKGGKGLFTKELEESLLRNETDLAVHSAKDMPTECPEGLTLATFVEREDPRDVLVLKEGIDNPKKMATGSPRRQAQLRDRFEDCEWIQRAEMWRRDYGKLRSTMKRTEQFWQQLDLPGWVSRAFLV